MPIHQHVIDDMRAPVHELRSAIPGVFKAYSDMHRESMSDGALPAKIKELIALAIAVTRECDGCIATHARSAVRRQASAAEVAEAMGVAILMNGGPATVYGPRALQAFTEFAAASTA
jgi:AhpD family alkylhydroperoxidase